jgi:hypothetical protein
MDISFNPTPVLEPAERLIQLFRAFAEEHLPPFVPDGAAYPRTIRLEAFPRALIDAALSDATAHTLISMAHVSRSGRPFQSILGFHYMAGKIHVMSRAGAAKIKLLQENPGCSFLYHSNVASPSKMACLTLVGTAKIIDDRDYIHRANEAMIRKSFRDRKTSAAEIELSVRTMDEADRRAVVLDEIEGVYLNYPAPAHLPTGMALPVLAWRA